MPIIEEDGGRLNAFAKEPKIELIKNDSSNSNGSRVLMIVGLALLAGLIAFTLTIN